MSNKIKSVEDLFKMAAQVGAEAPTQEKVAEESQDETTSQGFEAELYAGGGLIAEGFVDRALEKIAMSIPAAGGGTDPRSTMESIAAQIHARRGKGAKVGDDTGVRAEDTGYKGHGSDRALSGKVEKPNPARALPKRG